MLFKFQISIIILIILLFFIVFHGEYYKYENRICFKIYEEDKFIYNIKILNNIFSENECLEIIKEGEIYAKKNNWLKERHKNYPTTDNEIKKLEII